MSDATGLHEVMFDGAFLRRGFWLYVWEVTPHSGTPVHYVGRTGDNSSPYAQSPFVRMGQHLGFAKTSMMLRKHLSKREIDPVHCRFRLLSHGPVISEVSEPNMQEHKIRRDIVAAIECALCRDLRAAGYDVMNEVRSSKPLDEAKYSPIKNAFAAHFERLHAVPSSQ